MTWLPVTLVTFPVWPGYWHDLGPRQNLPSKCLCLGQMVIPSSWILDKCWVPALAMINLASVTSLHFDKWQLAKWAGIFSLHSESKTSLSLFSICHETSTPFGVMIKSFLAHFKSFFWHMTLPGRVAALLLSYTKMQILPRSKGHNLLNSLLDRKRISFQNRAIFFFLRTFVSRNLRRHLTGPSSVPPIYS